MGSIAFIKVHGLGNDYLLIDEWSGPAGGGSGDPGAAAWLGERTRRLCDRRRGVGADGVLVLGPGDGRSSDARLSIVNSDGSAGGVCGTGIRCAAAHLVREGRASAGRAIRIDVGPRIVVAEVGGGGAAMRARVRMGALRFEPGSLPCDEARLRVRGDGLHGVPLDATAGLSDARLLEVRGALVSVGNPHLVCPLGEHNRTLRAGDIAALGAAMSRHPAFPEGVNTHIVEPPSREGDGVWRARVVTSERGTGLVPACTTGACAVAGALWRLGMIGPACVVSSEGGSLLVRIEAGVGGVDGPAGGDGAAEVSVEGEAVEVCRGVWTGDGTPDGWKPGGSAAGGAIGSDRVGSGALAGR